MEQGIPGATNLQVRGVHPVPELQPLMNQLMRSRMASAENFTRDSRARGLPGHAEGDGVFFAIHLVFDRGGRRWEQLGIIGVHHTTVYLEHGNYTAWGLTPGRNYTVPEGELGQHLPTLVAIADSLQTTAQWQQMKNNLVAKLNQIAQRGIQERDRISREGWAKVRKINQQTRDIVANTYNPNAGDKSQRDFINMIHEVEDYNNPNDPGTSVQLPSGYNKAYSNGNGEIIMTNDVLTDPNVGNLGPHTWSEMTVRQ